MPSDAGLSLAVAPDKTPANTMKAVDRGAVSGPASSHPLGSLAQRGVLQAFLQVVDDVLSLHHDGPAPSPGDLEEAAVGIEGYGGVNKLQKPHVGEGISHPHGILE